MAFRKRGKKSELPPPPGGLPLPPPPGDLPPPPEATDAISDLPTPPEPPEDPLVVDDVEEASDDEIEVVDDDDDTLFLSSTKTRQRMSMARSSDLRPRDTKLCVGSKTVVTTDAKCLTDISPSLVVAAKTRGTAATSGSQHKEKLTVPEVQQKSSSAATTSNKAQSQKQKTRASSRLSLTPYEQAAMLRSGKKRTSM